MRIAWIVALLTALTPLSGCLNSEQAPDELQDFSKETPKASTPKSIEIAEPRNSTFRSQLGTTFVLAPPPHQNGSVAGYDLPFSAAEWKPTSSGSDFLQSYLRVVPVGNVTGYMLLLFDGNNANAPYASIISMPYEFSSQLAVLPNSGKAAGGLATYSIFIEFENTPRLRAVAAIQGDGALLVDMMPGPPQDESALTEKTVRAESSRVIEPVPIGVGNGFAFDAYFHSASLGVFQGDFTYGDVVVSDTRIVPASADPLLDVTAHSPAQYAGWHYSNAIYLGYEAHGFWDASISGAQSVDYQGIVAQDRALFGTSTVETIAFGLPGYIGWGDSPSPLESQFHVDVSNVDNFEIFQFMDISLGATLQSLLGARGTYESAPYYGLLGEVPPTRGPDGSVVVNGPMPITLVGL